MTAKPRAAWRPDPTGRHELRYWDGDGWTDDVADDGVAGADRFRAISKWSLALTIGAVVFTVFAAVIFFKSSGGSARRTGIDTFTESITDPRSPVIHRLSLEANQVLLIAVESKLADATPAALVLVDPAQADRIADQYDDFAPKSDASLSFMVDGIGDLRLVDRPNGDGTTLHAAVPITVSGDYRVAVIMLDPRQFQPIAGSFRLTLDVRPMLRLQDAPDVRRGGVLGPGGVRAVRLHRVVPRQVTFGG